VKRVAKVEVLYTYRNTYKAIIDIPDSEITEVLDEWALHDHDDDWIPDADDIQAAISELLENDYNDALDPTMDEEVGWGDFDWLEENIIEPYNVNKPAPEIPGQESLL
jgi:hypothetical protein